MALKSKFEDEKNQLDIARKRLDEGIKDVETTQNSFAGSGEYEHALIYQRFAKILRDVRIVCGEDKPKEDKIE